MMLAVCVSEYGNVLEHFALLPFLVHLIIKAHCCYMMIS